MCHSTCVRPHPHTHSLGTSEAHSDAHRFVSGLLSCWRKNALSLHGCVGKTVFQAPADRGVEWPSPSLGASPWGGGLPSAGMGFHLFVSVSRCGCVFLGIPV